jgi:TolB-like protein
MAAVERALVCPRLHRPIPAGRAIAIASLTTIIWIAAVWTYTNSPRFEVQVPPIAARVVVKPTVAIFFDGPEGDAFVEALANSGRFRIVERKELDRILPEIERAKTSAVDLVTAQHAGRVLGAEYLLFGNAVTSSGQVQIHARLVRTETTEYVLTQSIQGEAHDATVLAARLAQRFRI